jgi:hypothetical protein
MIEKGETAPETLAASETKSTSVAAINRDPLQYSLPSALSASSALSGVVILLSRRLCVSAVNLFCSW